MNSRHFATAVTAIAVAGVLGGCASNAGTGPVGAPSSTVVKTTPAPPASRVSTGGGLTMSAPHIACQQGTVEQTYDGADSSPVELSLVSGATAHVRINPPAGSTWPLPSAQPATVVEPDASRPVGTTLDFTLVARANGTPTLAVARLWQLQIAVV
jgi:hypothetical protein